MTFSLTPQQRRNVSIAAISAVAVFGIASIIFKTYPHLKPSFLGGKKPSDDPDEDEVLKSTVVVNKKDIADWSDDDLKAFLKEVSTELPFFKFQIPVSRIFTNTNLLSYYRRKFPFQKVQSTQILLPLLPNSNQTNFHTLSIVSSYGNSVWPLCFRI